MTRLEVFVTAIFKMDLLLGALQFYHRMISLLIEEDNKGVSELVRISCSMMTSTINVSLVDNLCPPDVEVVTT